MGKSSNATRVRNRNHAATHSLFKAASLVSIVDPSALSIDQSFAFIFEAGRTPTEQQFLVDAIEPLVLLLKLSLKETRLL